MALAVVLATESGMEHNETAKHPGAFRTISEVADELDVPQHVLRFWESRFSQVRPVKRAGGRRYYRPDDVDLLRGIRRLLHGQGYTIKGAQRIFREQGIRFVQAVGRGEAEVGAPVPHEVENDDPGVPPPADFVIATQDRALLASALSELRACREALSASRSLPDEAE